jgi:hypothetical protein
MARPLRIEYPGAVYHITSRGNARENIYLSDEDRENFLDTIATANKRFNLLCQAIIQKKNYIILISS